MQRVLVIGSPGAGKSTLARDLAGRLGLPLFHLDRIHWLPGWVERDRDEARAELVRVLGTDRWIIDGNYGSSLPLRIARADTVVWLDYPTWLCVTQVLRRWLKYRGTSRPDITEGCMEQLNLEFLHYIARFRRSWGRRNAVALAGFGGTLHRFESPAATAAWLARL